MNELRDAALGYAQRGWHVFPLHGIVNARCTCGRSDCSSPGKHPLVRRGVHESTLDRDTVQGWWRKRRRANVGLATGSASGIVVIDVDLPAALDSVDRVIEAGLAVTLTGLTGGGGVHLIYGCPDVGLGNSVGRLPGIDEELPGIDLRANGGYVVAPPSVHVSGRRYSWLSTEVPVAPAPAWLKEQPPRPIQLPPGSTGFTGEGTPYGLAVLRNQLDVLRRARVGERNDTLNRCAFIVGLFIHSGHLAETSARKALHATALELGLPPWEVNRTLDSALSSVAGGN